MVLVTRVLEPMEKSQHDELWQHVAELRPQLRKDIQILRQDYRGDRWYLLHDESGGRYLRFNAAAYEVLGRLDGDLTIQEILVQANTDRDETTAINPDDVLQIMAQLRNAEALRGGLPLSVRDVLSRFQETQRFQRRRTFSNPLAMTIPLYDPDQLLNRLKRPARLLFSWFGLWLWLGVVGVAILLLMTNLSAFSDALNAKTLNTSDLFIFWLLYPVIKALHELGHGMAVKSWGGEVHDTGINLLVFMPVPYIDASAAWTFRDKRRRALVGAAGILVELFLAALGVLVFLLVEPGLIRDQALNVALICSASTLLFNGNPLLRFDGYYVLEDIIELPNLAARSSRYYLFLIQRYLLGLRDARSPKTAHGERRWFVVYGLLAPLYKLTVIFGIALYLAAEFIFVGVLLASWAIVMQIIKPLYKSIVFIATSKQLEARRLRGFAMVGGLILICGGLLTLPMPLITHTEGIIWVEKEGQLVSSAEGFITDVLVEPGQTVKPGDLIMRIKNRELDTRWKILEAQLREYRTRRTVEQQKSRVRAAIVEDDIKAVQAEIEQVRQRRDALLVKSTSAGRFFAKDPHELQGKFIRQGDLLGYIITPEQPIVRAVIDQARVGLLRSAPPRVEVMLAERLGNPIQARFLREVPAGTKKLPSSALGAIGGGAITVDTRDERGLSAAQKIFQFDLELPSGSVDTGVGGRVYVRLNHGSEALWQQWSRSLRQLLLSRLKI